MHRGIEHSQGYRGFRATKHRNGNQIHHESAIHPQSFAVYAKHLRKISEKGSKPCEWTLPVRLFQLSITHSTSSSHSEHVKCFLVKKSMWRVICLASARVLQVRSASQSTSSWWRIGRKVNDGKLIFTRIGWISMFRHDWLKFEEWWDGIDFQAAIPWTCDAKYGWKIWKGLHCLHDTDTHTYCVAFWTSLWAPKTTVYSSRLWRPHPAARLHWKGRVQVWWSVDKWLPTGDIKAKLEVT